MNQEVNHLLSNLREIHKDSPEDFTALADWALGIESEESDAIEADFTSKFGTTVTLGLREAVRKYLRSMGIFCGIEVMMNDMSAHSPDRIQAIVSLVGGDT